MNNIKELCKDISFRNLYNWNNIPEKILNNCTYSLGINNDEVILFCDTSIFGNGKTGLAICDNGLYWKNSFCSPRYLSWNAFRKRKILYDDNHIYIGENDDCYIYENADKLCSVLNNLKFNLKVDNVVEKTQGVFSLIKEAIDFINEFDSGNNNMENNNIENTSSEHKMISNNSESFNNKQDIISNDSNEVVEVTCYEEDSDEYNCEDLVKEVENVKSVLKYLSKDLIGELINRKVNNSEELKFYMIETILTVITLTGDEELLCFIDQDTKNEMLKLRNTLSPQLELVEDMLNSDNINYIDQEKTSLKKAINLYNHRVKTAIEECEELIQDSDDFEEDIEEIFNTIQIAVKDFRRTLKKMIKTCNLFIEKAYMEA